MKKVCTSYNDGSGAGAGAIIGLLIAGPFGAVIGGSVRSKLKTSNVTAVLPRTSMRSQRKRRLRALWVLKKHRHSALSRTSNLS